MPLGTGCFALALAALETTGLILSPDFRLRRRIEVGMAPQLRRTLEIGQQALETDSLAFV